MRYKPLQQLRASSTSVAKLLESASQENVTINGYIRSVRNQKTCSFAVVGDGTSLDAVQAVLSGGQTEGLSYGSAVSLEGHWVETPRGTSQSHELRVQRVKVLGTADQANYPLQKKYQTHEYLRSMPHLRTRTPFNSLMLRFRSQSIAQLTRFFSEKDFIQTHPPIITSTDCEGAGEVFNVDITDPRRSPTGEGAMGRSDEAMAQSVGNVWTLSPTFRAEKSDTSRHLSEFYMLEAEANFVDKLESIMDLAEDMLRNLTTTLHDSKVGQEIIHGKVTMESDPEVGRSEKLEQRWTGMMKRSWPRITYTDAVELLQKSNQDFQHRPIWGAGLQAEHERFIAESVGKGQPVFVTRYPQMIKPFYMLPSSNASTSGPTVDCFDLLVPEVCEIAGGSMREHGLSQLLKSMELHGLLVKPEVAGVDENPNDGSAGNLNWYVDLRRWGSAPHGGFGLGFDRLLGYLAGVQNIREVVTFPRWVGRCDC